MSYKLPIKKNFRKSYKLTDLREEPTFTVRYCCSYSYREVWSTIVHPSYHSNIYTKLHHSNEGGRSSQACNHRRAFIDRSARKLYCRKSTAHGV